MKEIANRVIRHNYAPFLGEKATNAFLDSGMADKEIEDGLGRCTVLFTGGTVVGFAITEGDLLHLLMVDVPFQGKGFGGKLLEYTEAMLFTRHGAIRLQTFQENADAIRFYLKNGWDITGQQNVPELHTTLLLFEKKRG